MSESPREDDSTLDPADLDSADQPVTGSPVGAADFAAGSARVDPSGPAAAASGGSSPGDPGTGPGAPPGTRFAPVTAGPRRRRRRFFVAGIVVGAAVIVIALCAGLLAVVSAIDGVRDRAGDSREARRLRDDDCRELEQRLNRLVPPGATTGPAARATAVRDENAAVRIYLGLLGRQRDEDAWRQLLDARTVYADALDRQAKSRTPAFYVSPRAADGVAVTDEIEQWSPAACAGPIHRLAVPEL